MRTVEEFKESAEKNNITKWNVNDCSICNYHCGYIIRNGQVMYDSGCDCVSHSNLQPRSWEDLAEQYNMQDHPNVIKEYDEFWKFETIVELKVES